ncbi:MAG TPA: TIGR02186 family protein [Microvirga sp.]|nr:TIGR02186 family protein [Microvirga sp.]
MRAAVAHMRAMGLLLLLGGLLVGSPGLARAETLVTSVSNHRVLITSNYTGTSIAVFGAIERDAQTVARGTGYDIVITVRGPPQFLVVREKERLGPVWINREQQKFPLAPAYLGVLSSRPLDEMTSPQLRQRQKVGLRAIINAADFTNEREGADDAFREALYRLKAREGLYLEEERGVTFLTPGLFRASIALPATAPPGGYAVEVALFADTVILARTSTSFELVKTGFEEQMGAVARDWSALYGLATALIALFFGAVANTIFRRD